jgi:hypothetical protein
VKELIQQFGLGEIFAHVCPGVIVIYSFKVWVAAGLLTITGVYTHLELEGAFILLVLAYTAGLTTGWLSNWLAARCYFLRAVRRLYRSPKLATHGSARFRRIPKDLEYAAITALGWFPEPLSGDPDFAAAALDYNQRIDREIYLAISLPGISTLSIPWDRLVLYRTIVASQPLFKGQAVLVEAEVMHRRFLFSLGVALAFAFAALQCFCAAAVVALRGGHGAAGATSVFAAAGVTTVIASGALRVVAGRWWELEQLLTYSWSAISGESSGS